MLGILASLFFNVRRIIAAALGWAVRNPMAAIAALSLVLACFQTWRLSSSRNNLERAVEALAGEKQAHKATIAGYAAAQKAFEQKQADNLARVAKEQEQINERTKERYLADAGSWKSRFDRLRADAGRGGSGASCLPAVPDTTGGTDAPGGNPGDATVAVRIDDLETLVNNSLAAQGLQRWVAEQGAVVTSPE